MNARTAPTPGAIPPQGRHDPWGRLSMGPAGKATRPKRPEKKMPVGDQGRGGARPIPGLPRSVDRWGSQISARANQTLGMACPGACNRYPLAAYPRMKLQGWPAPRYCPAPGHIPVRARESPCLFVEWFVEQPQRTEEISFFFNVLGRSNGGEVGIRTLGPCEGSTVFETAPFNRSGTSPRLRQHDGLEGRVFKRRGPYRNPCGHATG